MKNEPLTVTYSYWDGQGHRRTLTAKKGDTIGQFLAKVKEQLLPDFRDMRCCCTGLLAGAMSMSLLATPTPCLGVRRRHKGCQLKRWKSRWGHIFGGFMAHLE